MTASAGSYAATEAACASLLQAMQQDALRVTNAPAQLLGNPLLAAAAAVADTPIGWATQAYGRSQSLIDIPAQVLSFITSPTC